MSAAGRRTAGGGAGEEAVDLRRGYLALMIWRKALVVIFLAVAAGCDQQTSSSTRTENPKARQAGREMGEAARKAGDTLQDVAKGFKEGVGGSGHPDGGYDGGNSINAP